MFKKTLIIVFACFNLAINSYSQDDNTTIRELLELNTYSKDEDAEAVIIYDIGKCEFLSTDYGFEIVFTRNCRMKILTEAGLKYTKIGIPLYAQDINVESINELKASAYNLENEKVIITESNKKNLFEEKIDKNWIRKTMAIDGAKVGSVIDFKYTISSPYLFNLHDWEFQYDIPVIYSEFTTYMIPFYTYNYIIIGTNKLHKISFEPTKGLDKFYRGATYKEMKYTFIEKDIPAFKDYSFISSPTDYKIKLDFQLSKIMKPDGSEIKIISTWEDISKKLLKHYDFGKYLNACKSSSKKIVSNMLTENMTEQQKVDTLTYYVKNNFSWDGDYGMFASKKANLFFKEKAGNDANINLFMASLLNQAGIEAKPVILSTRNHGKIYDDFPFTHFFNYVIVLANIDNKQILIDATEKHTTYDQLPYRCINDKGLIIEKDKVNWVLLNSKKTSIEDYKFYYQLNENLDSLQCSLFYTASGFDAIREKENYTKNKDLYFENIKDFTFDEINNTEVNTDYDSKYFKYNISGNCELTKINNYVSLQPFMKTCINENPFNKDKRDHPVDLVYCRKKNFTAQIKLPENTEIINQPENKIFDNDLMEFAYIVNYNKGTLIINGHYRFKKPIYKADEYFELKKLNDDIINALNSSIEFQITSMKQ